jgi:hypothetical protein
MKAFLCLCAFMVVVVTAFKVDVPAVLNESARFESRCIVMQRRLGASADLAKELCIKLVKFNKSK